jgi:VWFA-related protein
LLLAYSLAQTSQSPDIPRRQNLSQQSTGEPVRVPSRPATPLFKGKSGKQKTEIHFDPATKTVTIKLVVQDPNGYFIPNIRREDFVVYENGVRQQNTSVEVEHAPASLGMLLEFGGRIQGLNHDLGQEVSRAGEHLLDEVGKEDSVAIWKYSDKVEQIAGFTQDHLSLYTPLLTLGTPELSESNLYDAVIFTTNQMRPLTGRKAIVLISSGIDTFSKANYQDALNAAQNSDTPIYALSLVPDLRQLSQMHERTGPVARIDWNEAEHRLEEIARVSGGRTYAPENMVDLAPIYDDMLENLKVRYVITYRASNDLPPDVPRKVRVELVDPKTGGSLGIIDSNGKKIPATVVVQDSYTPSTAPGQ